MKKAYKLAALAATVVSLGILLGGCGGSDAKKAAPKAQATLKVGVDGDFQPYTYKNNKGQIIGLDVDLATEAAKRANMKAQFVPIKWAEKDNLLNKGEIDCVWSCYSMDGREQKYSWSKAYMKSGQYVLIKSDSKVLRLEDLNGKTIAAQSTTKFLDAVKKGKLKAGKILEFPTTQECVNAVVLGKAEATGGHLAVMLAEAKKENNKNLEVLTQQPLSTNKIGVAFKKGETTKHDAINKALGEMYKDGTTEKIAAKYYLSKDVLLYE